MTRIARVCADSDQRISVKAASSAFYCAPHLHDQALELCYAVTVVVQHVAIQNGRLVDHDADGLTLSRRIDSRYPNTFVLIRKVEAQPKRVLQLRSQIGLIHQDDKSLRSICCCLSAWSCAPG